MPNILSIYREKEIGNALNGETKVDIFLSKKKRYVKNRLVVCIIYNVKKTNTLLINSKYFLWEGYLI